MNSNPKPKSGNMDAPQQLRHMTEDGAERSREIFEKITTATAEVSDVMKNCCSTAAKGMQEYNSKVLEFAQANIKSHSEFLQKLAGVKSPSEFLEMSTDQARRQLETLGEQAKELSALAQGVTLATAEPLKRGFAKAYNHAA